MDKMNLLVLLSVDTEQKKRLESIASGCTVVYADPEEVTEEQVTRANIILGNPPAAMIRGSENLKLLQLESAGTDAYLAPGVLNAKTALCNATGAYGPAVSEHAFALTVMLMKKLNLYRDAQRESRWSDYGTVASLSRATVLVVGLGDIGLRYARMCKAMGAYVIGVKRRAGACPEGVDELELTENIDRVLPRADVVFSILPNTGSTVHFYTDERFAEMKNTAYFINCGRGNAVDGEVLLRALQKGEIAGAAVDVTDPEPLPAESPLWKEEKLVITPHISGGHHLPETFERIVDIACENLQHCLNGEALRNVVDMATGYKK
ncbi:MAG: D-2-hydroxyacid dehydrogenase [Oscillospiraceae bacterium]|nr:D-2-hydroxyacid dehydrogenase [Oscillospiraceae bacterium]